MSISETAELYRQRSKLWFNNTKWNYQAFYSVYRSLGVRKLVIPVGITRSERVKLKRGIKIDPITNSGYSAVSWHAYKSPAYLGNISIVRGVRNCLSCKKSKSPFQTHWSVSNCQLQVCWTVTGMINLTLMSRLNESMKWTRDKLLRVLITNLISFWWYISTRFQSRLLVSK